MHDEHRPESLTIDLVLSLYRNLLAHKIRQFNVADSVEDCLHQIILQMITRSETLGTSYLERYSPERGSAKNYVVMFCVQQMMKMTSAEANRRRLMPEPSRICYEVSDGGDEHTSSASGEVLESTILDPSWSPEYYEATIRTPGDLREYLADTVHVEVTGWSAAGEPQSTVYMLELMLWGGLPISEVAHRLGVSTSHIHRRLAQLRKDPKILALRQDYSPAA
jgi:hypothetical protein